MASLAFFQSLNLKVEHRLKFVWCILVEMMAHAWLCCRLRLWPGTGRGGDPRGNSGQAGTRPSRAGWPHCPKICAVYLKETVSQDFLL